MSSSALKTGTQESTSNLPGLSVLPKCWLQFLHLFSEGLGEKTEKDLLSGNFLSSNWRSKT